MSKNYFPLLTILFLAALTVGSFAFYKSLTQTTSQKPIAQIPLPVLSKTPTPSPVLGDSTSTMSAENPILLEIESPQAEASVSSRYLTVSGKTATAAAVTVADKKILADKNGLFQTLIRLQEGANLVVVEASIAGKSAVWQTVVTYFPAQPKTISD